MPVLLLLFLVCDLFTIFVLAADILLIKEWLEIRKNSTSPYGHAAFWWATGLTFFLLLGKFPVSWVLSSTRKEKAIHGISLRIKGEMIERPDGSVIHVEQDGNPQGPVIIFVHGWSSNLQNWYYQREYFRDRYRLIFLDLPGLGKSKRPDNRDYSLQKMAADLGAVICHYDLKDVVLWGHSIGGMVILTWCTEVAGEEERQKVRGLILQHTTYTDPSKTTLLGKFGKVFRKPLAYPACYLMIALSPVFWLNKWLSYFNGGMHLVTRLLLFTGTQTARQLDYAAGLAVVCSPAVVARGVLGMLKTYDVKDQVKKLEVPALVIGARKDRLTRIEASRFLASHLRKSTLIELDAAGHQGLLERHSETNCAADQFLVALPSGNITGRG